MKFKVVPILVFSFFALTMYMLARYLPFGQFEFTGRTILMYFLSGLAVVITFWSLILFKINNTTVDPLNPNKTTHLVTNGIYGFSRNPMYLAMLLLLLALGLFLGNAFNTLLAAAFVMVMNKTQIVPEEAVLGEKFGQEYKLYLKAVRRWF